MNTDTATDTVAPFDPTQVDADALAVWMCHAEPRDVWDIEDAASTLDRVIVVRRVIPGIHLRTALALLRTLNYRRSQS